MREAIKKFFNLRLEFGTVILLRGDLYERLQEASEEDAKAQVSYAMNNAAYEKCKEIRGNNNCHTRAWRSNMIEARSKAGKAKLKHEELLAAYRDFEDANDNREEVQ